MSGSTGRLIKERRCVLLAQKMEGFTDEEFDLMVNPITKELIKDFLTQKQYSGQTLKQYKSALYIFARWVHEERDNKPLTELKIRDALRYQNHMIDLDLSDSGIKFKRSAVSSLFKYIEAFWSDEYPDCRNIFTDAVPKIGNNKKKQKEPLTKRELNKLIKELSKREEWQKLAYLMFTYSTGCRREESRQLKKEVINYKKYVNVKGEEKNYYVTHDIRAKGGGKEGKIRKFQFDEGAMEAIKKWIEVRGDDDNEFVFTSTYGGEIRQVAPETFNRWCELFSEILDKKVHPHLLRSSRATIGVVEEGKDIESLRVLLGHNSSATTEIYVVRGEDDSLDDLF